MNPPSAEAVRDFLVSTFEALLSAVKAGEKGISLSVRNPLHGDPEIKIGATQDLLASLTERFTPGCGYILRKPQAGSVSYTGREHYFTDGQITYQSGWSASWTKGEPPSKEA